VTSGGGSLPFRRFHNPRQHRRRITVQDLLARLLADLRVRQRLPDPINAERAAVGAADLGGYGNEGRVVNNSWMAPTNAAAS
jgi:hypothetical protein